MEGVRTKMRAILDIADLQSSAVLYVDFSTMLHFFGQFNLADQTQARRHCTEMIFLLFTHKKYNNYAKSNIPKLYK